MFIHFVDGPLGNFPKFRTTGGQWATIDVLGWNSTQIKDIGHASSGVRSAAETKQKNPIAGPIVLQYRLIAIDNILRNACPKCGGKNILDPAATFSRTEPGIIKSNLLRWIYFT